MWTLAARRPRRAPKSAWVRSRPPGVACRGGRTRVACQRPASDLRVRSGTAGHEKRRNSARLGPAGPSTCQVETLVGWPCVDHCSRLGRRRWLRRRRRVDTGTGSTCPRRRSRRRGHSVLCAGVASDPWVYARVSSGSVGIAVWLAAFADTVLQGLRDDVGTAGPRPLRQYPALRRRRSALKQRPRQCGPPRRHRRTGTLTSVVRLTAATSWYGLLQRTLAYPARQMSS